ncbi:fatty acid synthase S-acetyltransferase [Nemania sp. FL0031]|nr:fatty acid synthase S-acetyltransferase [Nemania sp. FL0031]
MTSQHPIVHSEPFAIVGLSLKLAQNVIDETSLWHVLEGGRNLRTNWPENRISPDSFDDGGVSGKPNTIKGPGAYFVEEDPAVFDAPFFSITTKEAAGMNPQQRWALEASYHAFENAGIPVESLRGSRTAVFGTYMMDDFMYMSTRDPDQLPRQATTGLAPMMIANRVSWYFCLQGPSVLVETGCSSAMVAIDMACNAMRSGDADMALIVGSTMLLSPESTIMLSSMNFLSPDARSYSFDARANGYARGEGIVALVLKPLQRALNDGDVLRAVVRATGQNQDGRTPTLTQPSAEAQETLIRHVYAKAGLNLEDTRYFEAHGTGTPTGDVIEMTAIGGAFRQYRSIEDPLFVGTIKPNIGHLEASSACASIVKAIMILEKGIIPPNSLFERLNPGIDADHYRVPTECTPWPTSGLRRISVNSFGAGGANAHAILDDAYHYLQSHGLVGFHHCHSADVESQGTTSPLKPSLGEVVGAHNKKETNGNLSTSCKTDHLGPHLLAWSAADAGAARRTIDAYQAYFTAHVAGNVGKLEQLAHTLATRRSIMSWRSFAIVDAEDRQLSPTKAVRAGPGGTIAFVFTGQGAQYADMGLELLRYPVFRTSLQRSDDALASIGCEWSLFDAIHDTERIHRPEFSQPLCTALQIALVELFQSFGISPAVVIGHSSGEIAAAYAVGALSHVSACRVAYWRGQLAGKLRTTDKYKEAMMSVNIPEAQVPAYLDKFGLSAKRSVHIACVNSPTNVTLSGSSQVLDIFKSHLDQEGIFAHKLNTGVAYHSPTMNSIAHEYMERLEPLESSEAERRHIPMISSVTAHIAKFEVLCTPKYWVDNLVSPVRFSDAIRCLITNKVALPGVLLEANTITDIVEIGPHPALKRPIKDGVSSIFSNSPEPTRKIRYHHSLERSKSALTTVATLVGTHFCHGHPVSVAAFNRQVKGNIPALVDCPPYPFDHSRRYWNESRLSRDFRLRTHSPGHLLGRRSNDWNALHPRWRNWLCLETMPWLADHVISDSIVLPGAGMIVMALEAVKQLLISDSRIISGFFVRQGGFLAPITVGETAEDATETELHIRPVTRTYEKEITSYEARIFSYRENHWAENFRAEIQAEYEMNRPNEVDGGQETQLKHHHLRKHVEQSFARCDTEIDTDSFYAFMQRYGSAYGESFKQLRDIKWDGHATAVAVIDMASAKKHYTHPIDSPVHPSVLDASVHLVNSYVSKGMTEPLPTLVPLRFACLWISAKVWDQETMTLRLVSELRNPAHSNSGTVEKNLYGVSDDGSPLVVFDHLTYSKISRGERSHEGGDLHGEHDLLYGIAWKPQLSALDVDGKELQKLCDIDGSNNSYTPNGTSSVHYTAKLERAMVATVRKALETVTQEHLNRGPDYLRKYASWLQDHLGSDRGLADVESEVLLSDNALDTLLCECEAERPAWRFLPAITRCVGSILRAEENPMEVLSSASTAIGDYYSDLGRRFQKDGRLTHFLDLASHETPELRILEVGSGTGGMTRHVLADLQSFEAKTGQTRFAEYTFTDVSSAVFDARCEEFSAYRDRMSFKLLDVEHDPTNQGYEATSYDLVIAANVLHATSDLNKTLRHLHSLLRPRGYLVVVEPTSYENACINIGFGCFEDWWAGSEPWRQRNPIITEPRWNELMRETGFSEAALTIRDHGGEDRHFSTMMIAQAVETTHNSKPFSMTGAPIATQCPTELILLLDRISDTQASLAVDLVNQYPEMTTKMVDLASFSQGGWIPPINDYVVISLLEVEQPRLTSLSNADFLLLKDMIQAVPQILWVMSPRISCEGNHNAHTDPHYSLATGLLRVMRSEDPNKRLVTLRIEEHSESHLITRIKSITKVLGSCFLDHPKSAEVEFVVQDGYINIARTLHEISLDEKRVSRTQPHLKAECWGSGPAVTLEVGTPGLIDTLRFVEDPEKEIQLQPNEVEIKAAAWPISFRDLFIALGRLSQQEKMGYECAGTVTHVGTACSSVQVGDRVVLASFGSMCSHPRAVADLVLQVPSCLSLSEAVAIMNPGMTAFHALVNIARLQPKEKVLIHSAAGATGQVAIRIAKMIGAEVLTTVSSKDKKQLLIDRFSIPEDHIFYSRDISFAQGVKRITSGYGVDVLLNSLAGDSLRASWECIAPYGRFVEIGKVDISANSSLPMGQFAKNTSFAAIDLVHIHMTNKQLTRQLMQKALDLATNADGLKTPFPLHFFPASQIEKAFRFMQSGKHSGRILVRVQDSDEVMKLSVDRSTWRFSQNATYVVAGGLGGLGRPIIRWMADRGAKYLIILSRSGPASQTAVKLVEELRARGLRVSTPRCDVSSVTQLSAALDNALINSTPAWPPIKGCINATMVLQDSIFENMTHAQWSTSIRSKVDTSWNLHQLLPGDLDFFILLSSIVGVYGSPGQGNYAAGCTFQDALARHRTAAGHRASVSLDLGWMRDDGVVHESADYQRRLASTTELKPVATADMLALLDHYCDPALPPLTIDQSQLIVGASMPVEVRARGGDAYWASRTRLFSGFDVTRAAAALDTDQSTASHASKIGDDAARLFKLTDDPLERTKIVVEALKAKLARALGVETDEIDSAKGLADYGVDSLMAVELRNWVLRDYGVTLAVFEIMQGGRTIGDVGTLVQEKSAK